MLCAIFYYLLKTHINIIHLVLRIIYVHCIISKNGEYYKIYVI